jgi:hypothetical protein
MIDVDRYQVYQSAIPRRYLVVVMLLLVSACSNQSTDVDFIARVGNEYLTRDDVELAMGTLPSIEDSASAVAQFVDQWVTNALLAQEARDIGLDKEQQVRRLIVDSEKSVLISSLLSRIYSEESEVASASDVRDYFELNKDRLKTVEPYVKVRYLANADREAVRSARRLLQRAMQGSMTDSLWTTIVEQHSDDTALATAIASAHHPESRLLSNVPEVFATISRLGPGQISAVIASDEKFHLVQVVDRVAEGSEPYFEWVNGELTRQLTLQKRKEAVARRIQELRTNALAKNMLDVK